MFVIVSIADPSLRPRQLKSPVFEQDRNQVCIFLDKLVVHLPDADEPLSAAALGFPLRVQSQDISSVDICVEILCFD